MAFSIVLMGCAGQATPPKGPEELNATLFHQLSAEYRAVVLHIFAAAESRLEAQLLDPDASALEAVTTGADKPPAIIVDVDETMLDNSPWQVRAMRDGTAYPVGWAEWCEEASAEPLPGAVEFAQAAAARGVTVFYVTNRDVSVDDATARNLAARGFPMAAGLDVVLTKNEREDWGSDKTSRRLHVAEQYRVVMLLGDNLGDFIGDEYTRLDNAGRRDAVDRFTVHWGTDWFMIPNAIYGGWSQAAVGYRRGLGKAGELRRKLRALDDGRGRP
jgi:acid phosphatase